MDNIEFFEEEHIYLVNGIIVPSVTTILGTVVFPNKYNNIPDYILKRAAEFGSGVHKAIELKEYHTLNDLQLGCVMDYMDLIKDNNVKELEHEVIVHKGYDFIGTADLILDINGDKVLGDIKTTSKLDKEYLSWQLSFYAYAMGFKGKLAYFHLPKYRKYGVASFGYVPRKSNEEIEWVLKKYKEIKENE